VTSERWREDPPIVISEWNTATGGVTSADTYPIGLPRRVDNYVDSKPNVQAFCVFVDQDPDGGWRRYAMSNQDEPRMRDLDRDYDQLLRSGWRG
jgi:hypothetical protein